MACPIEKQGDQIREAHARNQKAIVLVEDVGHDKFARYKTHVVHHVEGSACCHAGTIFHCIGARPAGRRRGSCSCMQCAALRGRGMTEARLFLFMSEAQWSYRTSIVLSLLLGEHVDVMPQISKRVEVLISDRLWEQVLVVLVHSEVPKFPNVFPKRDGRHVWLEHRSCSLHLEF